MNFLNPLIFWLARLLDDVTSKYTIKVEDGGVGRAAWTSVGAMESKAERG